MSTSPSVRWTDTQNDHHDSADGISDTQHTAELQERRTQRTGSKLRNTRHTLRSLDRKLDKIHCDLAQVSWSQRRNESQQRPRPLTGRNPPYTNALIYELTPATAHVSFTFSIRIAYNGFTRIKRSSLKHHVDMKPNRCGATRVATSRRCLLVPKTTQNFCTYLVYMLFRIMECTSTSRQHGNTVIY